MIIIQRKDTETIDRMVGRYKRKHRSLKVLRELKNRKTYTKKSVKKRHEILGAKYRLKKFG